MKRYLIIIILVVFILSLSVFGLYKYKEQRDISLSQIESKVDMPSENIAESTDTIPVEIDESQIEEKQVDENKIETNSSTDKTEEIKVEETSSPPSSPSSTTTKQSTSTTKKETTSKVTETPKQEEKTSVEPVVEVPKQEPKQETKKEETKKEEPTPKQEVARCTTNDNHFMGVGNSGKWFSSKAEAIKFYDDTLIYWDAWWQKTNSPEDDAKYYANCPYGYEIWSCAYCSKWTINFYYR